MANCSSKLAGEIISSRKNSQTVRAISRCGASRRSLSIASRRAVAFSSRSEVAILADRIENANKHLEPLLEAIDVIQRYGQLVDQLHYADRVKLAHAISMTVSSITIQTRMAKTGQIEHREYFGEMRLHESLSTKPIAIPDEAIGKRKIWREIAELARQSKNPIHLKDVCQHIGTKCASRPAHNVRRAEAAGLVKKIGHQGGWVVATK